MKEEVNKSIQKGFMNSNPLENFEVGNFTKENYNIFDLHRPYVDDIILVSAKGKANEKRIRSN